MLRTALLRVSLASMRQGSQVRAGDRCWRPVLTATVAQRSLADDRSAPPPSSSSSSSSATSFLKVQEANRGPLGDDAESEAAHRRLQAVYDQVASETLDALADRFDALPDEFGELSAVTASAAYDVVYSGGVLTVKLGAECGTYVLNKQSANCQIWLSSPASGPKRFDWLDDTWIYRRTGESLHQLLANEFARLLGTPVDFSKCAHAKRNSNNNNNNSNSNTA